MELAKKNLIERFNQELIIFTILLILMVIALCLTVILYAKKYKTITKEAKIAVPILLVFLIFLTSILIVIDIRYIKDLEYVKKSEFYQIEGEFIGYAKSISNGDDLTVTQSWPIIKNSINSETVSLNILNSDQNLEMGEHYTIIYLPNTKIAKVVQ